MTRAVTLPARPADHGEHCPICRSLADRYAEMMAAYHASHPYVSYTGWTVHHRSDLQWTYPIGGAVPALADYAHGRWVIESFPSIAAVRQWIRPGRRRVCITCMPGLGDD